MSGDWSYEELNKWIADPKAMASGTKMTFPGEKDPHKRADTLVHLQTLSDKPVPFPK
jgi:cytochrome c